MARKKAKVFPLNAYIFGSLRKIWRWYPERRRVLEISKVFSSDGKEWFDCKECHTVWPRKQVHVDHVTPVIDTKTGFVDWNTYIDRLFVPADKLQVLCQICHKIKSKEENKIRAKKRAWKKAKEKESKEEKVMVKKHKGFKSAIKEKLQKEKKNGQ